MIHCSKDLDGFILQYINYCPKSNQNVNKSKFLSTLLLGLKYGVVAVLATLAFLPVPIIIGDYFGRINTIGYYSGPLPALWILGISMAIIVIFSLPFFLSGFVLSL